MRVEVIRAYAGFSVGAVIPEMPGGQARTLIGRGYLKELPAAAAKQVQAPNNRAVQAAPANRAQPNQGKPTLKLR